MLNRFNLINISKQNLEIFQKGYYILGNTQVNLNNIKGESKEYKAPLLRKGIVVPNETKITFSNLDTIEATRKFTSQSKSVCVLNFASAKHPGGGFVNGSLAQEEMLCYKSNLYNVLIKHKDLYDWSMHNLNNGLYKSWAIYSNSIVVFRENDLKLCGPSTINVITCPAVNKNIAIKKFSSDKIYKEMYNRCKFIMDIAIENNQKNLILGAFGCGVFGNDPKDVANIFYDLFINEDYLKYFSNIEFAILGNKNSKEFIDLVKRLTRL